MIIGVQLRPEVGDQLSPLIERQWAAIDVPLLAAQEKELWHWRAKLLVPSAERR
jgi:hypothetical protein